MAKKLIALLLAAALCGTLLASCGNDGNNDDTSNDSVADTSGDDTTDTSADDTTAEATDGVTIEQLHEAIKNAYGEEYLPNMPLDAEMFASMFGVQPEWVDEMVAETPMIMMNVDTLIIVKPTEGNEENVLNALTAYAEMQKDGSLQYPMNQEKVKAIQCYAKGGFVFYYILGIIPDDILFAEGDEAEIAQLQYETAVANNQKATDAINALLGE